MTVSDETLSAYIDGELSAEKTAEIERAVKIDPALAARIEELKRPDALVAAAYSAIDREPMPEAVMERLRDSHGDPDQQGKIVQFSPGRTIKPSAPWVAPLAASIALAVGVGIGMQLASTPERHERQFPIAGVIDSSNSLFAALDEAPSATTVETSAGTITPVLTFKSVDGAFCREFVIASGEAATRGVACRDDKSRWVTQFTAISPPASSTPHAYSTASVEITAQFDSLVESMIAEEPLDDEAEGRLLGNW